MDDDLDFLNGLAVVPAPPAAVVAAAAEEEDDLAMLLAAAGQPPPRKHPQRSWQATENARAAKKAKRSSERLWEARRWQFPRSRAMADSSPSGSGGWLWAAVGSFGRELWGALGSSGRLWKALGRSGKLWEAVGSSGGLWEALGRSGKLWRALGSSGRLWEALGSKQAQIGWSGDYRENRRSTDENSEHSELRPPPEIFRMFRIFVGEAAVHAAVAGPSALVAGARGKF